MKLVKISAIALVLASVIGVANADKVGVVSLQTVFQQAPQGQATLDQIKQQLTPQMNQLKTEQSQITAAVNAFNKNSPTMSAADRQTQTNTLNQQQQQFQQDIANFHNAETQKQQAAAQNFQSDLVAAVQTVAKNGSYDMIMTDQTLPYYNPSYDVSSQVVNLMKKMN